MKRDLYKIVSYFRIYGLDLYGVKYLNLEVGKNNLIGYFCDKLGWSKYKLNKYIKLLRDEFVIDLDKQNDSGYPLYKLTFVGKLLVKNLVV